MLEYWKTTEGFVTQVFNETGKLTRIEFADTKDTEFSRETEESSHQIYENEMPKESRRYSFPLKVI